MSDLGIVIIGRNEGQRLVRCLHSVAGSSVVVYVDSGSTDGSPEAARAAGAVVVELDRSIPFTAARARNAGFARLMEVLPDAQYVQFVDGDCEIAPGWLDAARRAMAQRPELAAVCGRLRERFPEASIYNRLCDMEWNGPVGEIHSCGGIAMYRVAPLHDAGGFDAAIPAGEEPELCFRLRRDGWKIARLEQEMGWHDAEMTRFSQWWKRSKRGGMAYGHNAALHGRTPLRHRVKETRSVWFWGIFLPAASLAAAWPTAGWSAAALLGYPLLAGRVYLHLRRQGQGRSHALLYATFCVIAKFPQAVGLVQFHMRRWRGVAPTLIEYKGPAGTHAHKVCESPDTAVESVVAITGERGER